MRAVKKRPGDKICDICGNAGYLEILMMCSQCNTASEHIYCMQTVEHVASERWCCEKCSASHGVHRDGKLKDKQKNLDISDVTGSQFKKTKVHDQDNLSFNSPQCGEFDINEMRRTGSKKVFPSQDGSPEKLHVGKHRVSAKYLSHSSSFNRKEPSKVKPLSAEEVVQLTSGAVGRKPTSGRSFWSAANQSNAQSFRPPVSHRTHQSKSASSRPEENFHRRMKISFDSEVKCPPSNCVTARENDGEKVPAVLHGKQILNRSPSPDVLSPRCNTFTCSRSVSTAPYVYKTDGPRKRRADNILEPTKEEASKQRSLIEICSPSQYTKSADPECLNSQILLISDKKEKAANDEPTKEEALKKIDHIEVCSPSLYTKSADPKCLNSRILDISDKKKKTASGGEETFAKPHEACHFKNAESVKSGVADKELVLHNTTAVNMPPSDSGNTFYSETQLKEIRSEDKSLPLTSTVHPQQKISNCLTAEVRWKGFFDIFYLGSPKKFGMLAHCPRNFSIKVYDMAQQLPLELKLFAVPRIDVWPRAFQSDPPDSDDIGLYFLPSNLMRSQEDFFCFLERIDLGDFALRAWIGGVELLVFSSKRLPVDSQRMLNGIYLWGVFRHVKRKKGIKEKDVPSNVLAAASESGSSSQFNVPPVDNSKEVDTKVDLVEGIKIEVDTSMTKLGVPPGFTRPISGNVASNASFVASLADNSIQLNVPLEGDITKPDTVRRIKIRLVGRSSSRFDEPPGFRIPVSADPTSNVVAAVSQVVTNGQTNVPPESDAKEPDMKVDIVKGIGIENGIGLTYKSIPSPDALPGFARPISVYLPSNAHSVASQCNTTNQLNFTAESDTKKVHEKINIVGGTKIGSVDRFIPSLCRPPGFTRPISQDITSYAPIVGSMSTTDNQLNFSPECNSAEVDMDVDMVGGIEIGLLDKPMPRSDAPGFSKPILDDDHEERPLVKFSLQKVREISLTVLPFSSRNSSLEHQNNSFEINRGSPILLRTVNNSLVSLSSRDDNANTSEANNIPENNQVPPTESVPHLKHYGSSVNLSMEKNEVHAKDDVCFKNSDYALSLSSELPLPSTEEQKAFSSMEHHIAESVLSSAKHESNSLYECFTCRETKESEETNEQVTNYESPLPSSSEEQVLFGRRALPLFPVVAEFRSGDVIENEMNEQDVQLNMGKTGAQIFPDLSLSRPHYVQDGSIWISTAAQEKLKKDNCGDSLKLYL